MSLEEYMKDFDTDDTKKLDALAGVCEASERYNDMAKCMKKLVEQKVAKNENLDTTQRNLLSVAYKNVVGQLRSACRNLVMQNEDVDKNLSDEEQKAIPGLVNNYRMTVEKEVQVVCQEVLDILAQLLKQYSDEDKDADAKECRVFYLKMSGDYWRYLAEIFKGDQKNKDETKKFYGDAMTLAEKNLPETHPTRLGLALNYSVCHYEIFEDGEEACKLAKTAFDAAIEKLDTLNDSSYKDSTLIMQLLRDNLTLWTNSSKDEETTDKPA